MLFHRRTEGVKLVRWNKATSWNEMAVAATLVRPRDTNYSAIPSHIFNEGVVWGSGRTFNYRGALLGGTYPAKAQRSNKLMSIEQIIPFSESTARRTTAFRSGRWRRPQRNK